VTSIHTLSRDAINRVRAAGIGWQFLKEYIIKNTCKSRSEETKKLIKMGIRYKYVYLHPKTNSNILTVNLPETCP